MKKALIIIGVVGLVGVGVGYYIYKNQNKLNDSDFDAMIGLSKNKGYDVFEDMSNRETEIVKSNYLKYFDRKSHNDFISLLGKGESKWTPSEKIRATNYINKALKFLTKIK